MEASLISKFERLKAYAKQEGFTLSIDDSRRFLVSGYYCDTLDAVEGYMEGYLRGKRDAKGYDDGEE